MALSPADSVRRPDSRLPRIRPRYGHMCWLAGFWPLAMLWGGRWSLPGAHFRNAGGMPTAVPGQQSTAPWQRPGLERMSCRSQRCMRVEDRKGDRPRLDARSGVAKLRRVQRHEGREQGLGRHRRGASRSGCAPRKAAFGAHARPWGMAASFARRESGERPS